MGTRFVYKTRTVELYRFRARGLTDLQLRAEVRPVARGDVLWKQCCTDELRYRGYAG